MFHISVIHADPPGHHPGMRLCTPTHPISREALNRFARGRSTREERTDVMRHLLTGCPECCRHLAANFNGPEEEPAPDAYDEVFERLLGRTKAEAEREAELAWVG